MAKYGWGGNYQRPTYYQPPVSSNTIKAVIPEDCKKWLKNLFTRRPVKELAFTKYSWAKINCYINLIGDLEITGLGKIQDGKIIDIVILKQSVKSTYVSCDDDAIADYLRTLTKEERRAYSFLDWHSHVNMGVSPSTTDWDNYEDMLDIRMGKSFPIMIINKSQNVFCGNYFGKKKYDNINITYDLTPLTDAEFEAIYEECKKDIEEKCVEEKTYTVPVYYGYYGNEYNKPQTNTSSEIDGYADKNISEPAKKVAFDNCSFCNNKLYTPTEFKEHLCSDCIEERTQMDNTRSKSFCVTCGKEIISVLEKNNQRCSTCSAKQMFKSTDAEVLYCNDCGEKLLLIADKDSGLCRSCRTTRTNQAKEAYQSEAKEAEQAFCQECETVLEKRVEKVNNLCTSCLEKYIDIAELEIDDNEIGLDEPEEKCSNCQTELFTPIEFDQGLCEDCISDALQIYKKAT